MNLSKSAELFEKAGKLIPGGVNSPVRAFKSVGGIPPFIKRAEGAFIWDEDDNKYIDYIGSWGPMILGHTHPRVTTAIQKVVESGTSFGAPTEKEITLAQLIIDRVPGCEKVRLVNSGTEATMSAIRLARGFTGKDKIIKFEGCYHGHGDSFLIAAGSGALTLGEPNSPGVTKGTASDTLISRFNDPVSVEAVFEQYPEDIAGVIVEPVNGNTGCIPPENGFLDFLKNICHQYNSLLIFDEVMTGFRVAKGGAAEYYKVTPDLYTFGKVIGGGMPIGAFGGTMEIMEKIAPEGSVYQAGTLSGNPVAVTAGIETLKLLTDESYSILNQKGVYLSERIQSIIEEADYPLSQKRVGSMFSLYFYDGKISNTQDVAKCDFDAFNQFFHSLLEKGVFIAPSQFEAGFISLAHTEELLDATVEHVRSALESIFVEA
ncbi:MAG: glutamate-1-semialdehyde 2,1-aminomutase [Candidatus Marinimicrobia bacterium]|jgi:glutamate-1-semialdehyde 2,1-aminomutase|nr:glutamate-1-semialdehyde 2,1-aminomutase [Candidatus Neomarinimicrobiota bacterium]MDP6936096.1 glutamate-1-semialdehyde 2,1-aminomutase [Candidatus Neomarinimicrobiota bacterium]